MGVIRFLAALSWETGWPSRILLRPSREEHTRRSDIGIQEKGQGTALVFYELVKAAAIPGEGVPGIM